MSLCMSSCVSLRTAVVLTNEMLAYISVEFKFILTRDYCVMIKNRRITKKCYEAHLKKETQFEMVLKEKIFTQKKKKFLNGCK